MQIKTNCCALEGTKGTPRHSQIDDFLKNWEKKIRVECFTAILNYLPLEIDFKVNYQQPSVP